MSPLSLLTLTTAIFGFIVAGILIFSARHNRFVNRFLGFGFFGLSYRTLTIYLQYNHFIPDTFVMGSVSFVYYWILPALYLYTRTVINDEQTINKRDLLHFILPFLAISLVIFYLVNGFVQTGKINFPIQEIGSNSTAIGWPIPLATHTILLLCMAFIYVTLLWILVYRKFFKTRPSHPQAKKIRNWIILLVVPFTLLLIAVSLGAILSFFTSINTAFNTLGVRSLILIFVFSRVLLSKDLLYGLPDIETKLPVIPVSKGMPAPEQTVVLLEQGLSPSFSKNEGLLTTGEQSAVRKPERAYYDEFGWIHLHQLDGHLPTNTGTGPIEKDKVVSHIMRVNDFLKTEPFTDPEFSMQQISKALGIPVHHLEYLFRYYNKNTFVEFRNILRVRYTLLCMEQQLWKNYTLEAIGEKAGFASRTTFFRVFKQVTGKSPKSYLDTMQQSTVQSVS